MNATATADEPQDNLREHYTALIKQQQRLIDQLLALHQQQAPRPPTFQFPQPNVWTSPAVHTYTTGTNVWPMMSQMRPLPSP